jgi:hypothetical protein
MNEDFMLEQDECEHSGNSQVSTIVRLMNVDESNRMVIELFEYDPIQPVAAPTLPIHFIVTHKNELEFFASYTYRLFKTQRVMLREEKITSATGLRLSPSVIVTNYQFIHGSYRIINGGRTMRVSARAVRKDTAMEMRVLPMNIHLKQGDVEPLLNNSDTDPVTFQDVTTQCNVVMLQSNTMSIPEQETFPIPTGEYLSLNDRVAVVGYPAAVNEKVKECFTAVTKPTQDEMRFLFQGLETKAVSVGTVIAIKEQIAAIRCPTQEGMCGGGVFILSKGKPTELAGLLLNGSNDGTYNLVLSVHHPVFVAYYIQYILPDLQNLDEIGPKLAPWLHRNHETIAVLKQTKALKLVLRFLDAQKV